MAGHDLSKWPEKCNFTINYTLGVKVHIQLIDIEKENPESKNWQLVKWTN